jgi:hypothetical protein
MNLQKKKKTLGLCVAQNYISLGTADLCAKHSLKCEYCKEETDQASVLYVTSYCICKNKHQV